MTPLLKLVRVNGLQYNRNRDPQAYRRAPGEAFRIQALLGGGGRTRCTLTDAQGNILASGELDAPGPWSHDIAYPDAGTRLLRLELDRGTARESIDLRLDVVDRHHA